MKQLKIQAKLRDLGASGCFFLCLVNSVKRNNELLTLYDLAYERGALTDGCLVHHYEMADLLNLKYIGDRCPSDIPADKLLIFADIGGHWVQVSNEDIVLFDPLFAKEGQKVEPHARRYYVRIH